jgi:integrase
MSLRRGKYYVLVSVTNQETKKRHRKMIPLKTSNEVQALKRKEIVEKHESYIRKGMDFSFPWIDGGGRVRVKETTLEDAMNDWIEHRKNQPDIEETTIQINLNSVDHLYSCVGKKVPLKSVTTKTLQTFKDYMIAKGLSKTSTNMHLRTARSFFRYVWQNGDIDKLPMIKQIKVPDSDPKYFTDEEFHAITNEVGVDSFYGKVFFFYRETGMRLREPFIAKLDGNWLDIPNTSKGKRPRSIELDDFLIQIFIELREWADNCGLVEASKGRHLSKKFKKALRKCGIDDDKTFHGLRHTCAVRRIVMGEPYAMVQAYLGHRSISTTEDYGVFELKRLQRDFPTLVEFFKDDKKEGKNTKGNTLSGNTNTSYKAMLNIIKA